MHVRCRSAPDRFQINSQRRELFKIRRHVHGRLANMLLDANLKLRHAFEHAVPAKLQFRRDQTIGGVGCIVLSERLIRSIAGCLEVALERLEYLVAAVRPSSGNERGRASIIAPVGVPKPSRINAFNRSKAVRSTRGGGDSASATTQHAARSNIHSGTSRQRASTCAVSAHRNARALPLATTSWTKTRRPNHGCQG